MDPAAPDVRGSGAIVPQIPTEEMQKQAAARLAALGRTRKLVLVAEDERNDWEIYGRLLGYYGFDVIHALDGEEGLRLIRERRPDLVLLDLMLPKLDGIELCRRVKHDRATRDIPVIMLSARAEREFGRSAREAGCLRYLEKPIGPVEVLHAVEAVIGRPPPAGLDSAPDLD